MIRAAIALVLLLAVGPAFAQSAPAMRPSQTELSSTPQTQAQTPASKASQGAPSTSPAVPSPAYTLIPKPLTADQCRTTCTQSYYFCLAENEMQDCAPAWSQCRLGCGTAATK